MTLFCIYKHGGGTKFHWINKGFNSFWEGHGHWEFNETMTIKLPDGTKAILNGNSSLSYHKSNWEEERKVEIEGQVFFDIEKKGAFEVAFEGGYVSVLGTEFDVLVSDGFNSIKC